MLYVAPSLKILLVTHGFPPHRTAGTETYTAELGVALRARGHDVAVFTALKDISRPDYQLTRREHRGLVVHELVNNLFHRDFVETYQNPRVESAFDAVVESFRPDVVHVQHLLYLSSGLVPRARARGAAILFTLHDFWLQCPRLGQRIHADGGLCDTIDFARCGTCLPSFKFGQGDFERRVGGVLAGLRAGTGIDLGPIARGVSARLGKKNKKLADVDRAGEEALDPVVADRFARAADSRTRALKHAVVPAVDLFLAPSRFLRDRFVDEWGVPPDRVEHLRFGVDLDAFAWRPRSTSDKLRVSFLGSLVPLKGPHVLLDAWSRLDADVRARGRLALHGPALHHPEYQAQLARAAAACGAVLGGPLDRDGVARALAATDLLVVPSLWFENSPLVILEAIASRTPLLVSNLGGMAELVEPGVSGYHFAMGDAADLAQKLLLALEGRLGLDRLYARPPELPRFDAHVDAVLERYARFARATR